MYFPSVQLAADFVEFGAVPIQVPCDELLLHGPVEFVPHGLEAVF